MPLVQDFKQLRVYRLGFEAAMRVFALSQSWPQEERYSLTDQIRRSSRSVCSNIAEAWQKRLYVASFVSKLSDASAETAETLVWLDFAQQCGYLSTEAHEQLVADFRSVVGGLTKMIAEAERWCGPAAIRDEAAVYLATQPPALDEDLPA